MNSFLFLQDVEQKKKLDALAEMFATFGMTNLKMFLAMSLPGWFAEYNPFLGSIRRYFADIFRFFEAEYDEHKANFDPNSMGDYLDVYMAERNRANANKEEGSSFYGENGHWNYVNSIFDLFLAGSYLRE